MAEYIEREAAIDAAIIAFNRIDQYPNKNIRDLIGAVPAADVRPVVLCRDCKYSDRYCHCSRVDWWTNETDFCSRGKRREEGSDG